jgi:hypothetical protein
MHKPGHESSSTDRDGRELIAIAQKLARDAERHALLSASLASQADRLMLAGLEKLRKRQPPSAPPKSC